MGNTAGKHHPGGRKYVHWDTAVPPAPPGKPHLVPGTPNHQPDLVTISWEPPINDGGAPVTGYQVEHRRTGSPHWVRSTPNLVPVPELTLSGLEPGWRYQFRVCAKNAAGMSEPGDISEPLTVTLNRSAASAPHFVQELHDTIALENETAEFKVHFKGTPTPKIAWYKDGFEIFSSRRMRVVTEGDQSSLVIFQTAFSDEGEIKCTATNRVGHIVTRAKLRLEAPPSIRIPRQYEDGLLFEMGEIIRLKVSVAGRPLPRVTWFHNGEQVMFGGRYEVTNTDRSSFIRVAEARRADRGEYQVRATNRLGEDSASFLVTVTDRPVPPGKAQVVTSLGRSVTLSWSIPEDDGGCKIGNYIVEYYRIGWNVWLKAATCRQLTTTLGDLIEGSEYKFRVKAENPYGVSDPSEESDVVFIPDPKRGLLEPPARKRGSKVDVKAEDKSQQRPGSGRTTPQPVEVKKEVALAGKRKDLEDKLEPPKKGAPDIRLVRSKEWETIDRPVPVIMFDDKKPSETVKRMNKENVDKNTAEVLSKKIKGDAPPPVPPKTLRRPMKTEDQAQKQVAVPVQSKVQVQTQDMAVPKTKPVASNTSAKKQSQEERGRVSEDQKTTKIALDNRRRSVDNKLARSHLSPLSPREDDDSIMHGSSELMLVLLPEGESAEGHREERAQSERRSVFGNTFQESESLVAPPMSLSAPELGSGDSAITNPLRNAVSSTELLHEKAMARFYQAVAAEEAEKARQRRQSIERPVTSPARGRLASLEDEEELRRVVKTRELVQGGLNSLEDENELRKNVKGRVLPNQRNDKPTSLRKAEEPVVEQKIRTSRDDKVTKQLISEEEEQEEFARIRQELNSREGMKPRRERARQASEEEEEEDDDDTEEEDDDMEDDESLDASVEYDDDEDEPYHPRSFLPHREFRPKLEPSFISVERDIHSEDDEEDTYHPRDMTPRQVISFQITPQPEPNPEVLPKPILKQKKEIMNPERVESPIQETKNLSEPPRDSLALRSSKSPSPSPLNDTGESDVVVRRRKKEPPPLESSEGGKSGKEEAQMQDDDVGLSAAEIARKRRLQARQSSLEEEATLQRVVSSHYDDFIREYGRTKKRQIQLFTNTEDLKAAAFSSGENVSERDSMEESEQSEDVKTSTVLKEYDERWQKLQQKQEELELKWKKDSPQPINKQSVEEQRFDLEKEPIKNKLDQKPQEPPRQEKYGEEYDSDDDYDDEEEEDDEEDDDEEEEEEEEKKEEIVKPKSRWWWQRRQTTEDDQKIVTPSPSVAQVKISPPTPEVERAVSEPDHHPVTPQEEDKMKVAEKNVRSFIEYVSDIAMFSVACCLYIFENEVLAIPLLILMVYRQVYQAIKRKIPAKWKRSR